MSLIKLAFDGQHNPIIVVNNNNDSGTSKAFNKRNLAAAAVGGTTGFAANETIERLPRFNKEFLSHRYARRMASVGGGMLGAGAVYSYLKRKHKDQSPSMYFM